MAKKLKKPAKKIIKKSTKKPAKKQIKKPVAVKLHAPIIEVNTDWCKACYICVDICPKTVFGKSTKLSKLGVYPAKVERPAQCIMCRECEMHCPDLAINVEQGT